MPERHSEDLARNAEEEDPAVIIAVAAFPLVLIEGDKVGIGKFWGTWQSGLSSLQHFWGNTISARSLPTRESFNSLSEVFEWWVGHLIPL